MFKKRKKNITMTTGADWSWNSAAKTLDDLPVEVFLKNGKLSRPYQSCFQVCKLDRWSNPECIPGIISAIFSNNNLVRVVVHANDQYLICNPFCILCCGEKLHTTAKYHFIERGIDHLIDPTDRDVRNLEQLLSYSGCYSGQRNPETSTPRINVGWDTSANKKPFTISGAKSFSSNWDPSATSWTVK